MRIRTLLFAPALAAAVLGIGVSAASAATVFTTAAHGTRVSVGATWSATNPAFDVTAPPGVLMQHCHSTLGGNVGANNMTVGVTLEVTFSSFNCTNRVYAGTSFPWTLTITGNGSASGANTVFASRLDRMAFDVEGVGLFAGNLTTGITASQPTATGAPISVVFAATGGWSTAPAGLSGVLIDGTYTLIGTAATWSLTN